MESKKGTVLSGIEPVLAEIQRRLQSDPQDWLKSLKQNPTDFADVEKKIHQAFTQMADRVVAGLLAQATAPAEFADTAKKKVIPNDPTRKLRSAQPRPLRVRLFGGLLIWVTTLYCSPAQRNGKGRGPAQRKGRGPEGAGLYPELGLLGIQEGKSPALVRDIGRLAARLPYETVQEELAERGVNLSIKEVHAIGQHAGQSALAYRQRTLELYRQGKLAAGDGRGKRLGVMIDGGRTKLRKTTRRQKGKGKSKTQKRRFRTEWREPKLFIIFEMDDQGGMQKKTQPIIDGTFQGPDELMEVLAMRLHQLGAAQASVVAFRSDGAPWIWERLEWVRRRVGLTEKQTSLGLDWCHAVHHISLALKAWVAESERKRVFKKYRKWLKQGRWEKVVEELTAELLNAEVDEESEAWTAVDYLERHGRLGHLDYPKFRRRHLPVGSGAVESAIRRVINLRMKGNSIFWEEDNAEAMLVLRGLVLSRRWRKEFAKITESLASDRRMAWLWKSPDMPAQLAAGITIEPPKSQPEVAKPTCDPAA
jgi:hypothetical protein